MITMTRRFYKTAAAINAPEILGTYKEAVDRATNCIENGDGDEYYIVEVVAKVKPKSAPIVVEKIRK